MKKMLLRRLWPKVGQNDQLINGMCENKCKHLHHTSSILPILFKWKCTKIFVKVDVLKVKLNLEIWTTILQRYLDQTIIGYNDSVIMNTRL